jgi:endonuclease/exonuclease/phosphatase family metal-dependent hydrolase
VSEGSAKSDEPSIRIMTWNIHGGGTSRRTRDLERIVALVDRHAPDIVALQEVDSRPIRTGQRSIDVGSSFDFLTRALGGHSAEAKLVVAADGEYGHALISRWPLHDTIRHDVSLEGREPRAAVETTVETPLGLLNVVAVHLGLSFRERRRQAELLVQIARRGPATSVVLGDFNDWIWRGSVQRYLATCMEARTHHKTFPAKLPLFALDRIYCRPALILLRSWTDREGRYASDHLPVIADIAFSHSRLA